MSGPAEENRRATCAQGSAGVSRSRTSKVQAGALSPTMQKCVAFMREHGGAIYRHPGGFWAAERWNQWSPGRWFGTSTVAALVQRGEAEYTEWKDRPPAPAFPIKAVLKQQ